MSVSRPDKVFVISLQESAERRRRFFAEWGEEFPDCRTFVARSPKNTITPSWWCPEYADQRTRHGFYCNLRSHLDVIEHALTSGCEHLLVFEDDARRLDDFDVTYRYFLEQLPEPWLIYKLHGWFGSHRSLSDYCGVWTATGGMQAVGYSRTGMRAFWDYAAANPHDLSDIMLSRFSVTRPVYGPPHWPVGHDQKSSLIKGTEA